MRLPAAALALSFLLLPFATIAGCPPAGWDRAGLDALKARGFEGVADGPRQALARDLPDCLGNPDPALRDGIAYEALATWLRAEGAIAPATRQALLDRLVAQLSSTQAAGFEAPFAALVLSEVARTDRVAAWMTPAQRQALVEASAAYVEGIRDYRGFTDGEGWRHGVAHGADLLMQLALNPALDKAQLSRLMDAAASRVAPVGAPPYVHGESERLVRPVLFALQRGLHDEAEWTAWVTRVAAPAPMADWSEAYRSEAGLARRHNVRGLLLELYVGLDASGSEPLQARLPAVVAGLRALQ